MMILDTPLIENGREVINGTILKPLSEVATLSTDFLKSELSNSKYVKELIEDYLDNNNVDNNVIEWLSDNDFIDVIYE